MRREVKLLDAVALLEDVSAEGVLLQRGEVGAVVEILAPDVYAERPFDIDAASMRRHDVPPDYVSFREAAINLLIHQDYGDHTRKPVIKFFRDRTIFWNPGESFATADQLLDPVEKEVRNPAIVSAFRRIGLSDQAGTGVRSIFNNWQRLGNVPPVLRNSKEDKTFELVLLKEELLSEEQLLFQAHLGVHLSDVQAQLFAYACRSNGGVKGYPSHLFSSQASPPATGWWCDTDDQPRQSSGIQPEICINRSWSGVENTTIGWRTKQE